MTFITSKCPSSFFLQKSFTQSIRCRFDDFQLYIICLPSNPVNSARGEKNLDNESRDLHLAIFSIYWRSAHEAVNVNSISKEAHKAFVVSLFTFDIILDPASTGDPAS